MELISAINTLRCSRNAFLFLTGAKDYMYQIAEKELQSAIRTLDDVQESNNYEREISSVITQLRLSMEKFKCYEQEKFQIAALIALCYHFVNDNKLTKKYIDISCAYFDNWIEAYSYCPGKLHWKQFKFDRTADEVRHLGIPWNRECPTFGLFETMFTDRPSQKLKKELSLALQESKEYYKMTLLSLIS